MCWLHPKPCGWTKAAHTGLTNVHLYLSREDKRVTSWCYPRRRRKTPPQSPIKHFLLSRWFTLATWTFLNQSLAKEIWSQLLQLIHPWDNRLQGELVCTRTNLGLCWEGGREEETLGRYLTVTAISNFPCHSPTKGLNWSLNPSSSDSKFYGLSCKPWAF